MTGRKQPWKDGRDQSVAERRVSTCQGPGVNEKAKLEQVSEQRLEEVGLQESAGARSRDDLKVMLRLVLACIRGSTGSHGWV